MWILENVARVGREQAAFDAELERVRGLPDATEQLAARATLFRERGIALDTSIRPAVAIEEALGDALARGLLAKGGVRRVAVVGPGLDFVEKAEGFDFYPPQSLQALALADSLVRLGLADAASLRITALDISPRVLDHLARARSPRGCGPGLRRAAAASSRGLGRAARRLLAAVRRRGRHAGRGPDAAADRGAARGEGGPGATGGRRGGPAGRSERRLPAARPAGERALRPRRGHEHPRLLRHVRAVPRDGERRAR